MKKIATPTDEELIVAYKNGDKLAFDIFYKRHTNLVMYVSWRIVCDYEIARDISQEAFIRFIVYINSKDLPEQKNFKSFITTTSRNLSIDFLRRKGGLKFFSLNASKVNHDFKNGSNLLDYISSDEISALDKIIKNEEMSLIWDIVENLSTVEKISLRQKYFHGMKFEEIALLHGGPSVTWRLRSRRGIRKIREHFKEIEKKQD